MRFPSRCEEAVPHVRCDLPWERVLLAVDPRLAGEKPHTHFCSDLCAIYLLSPCLPAESVK